MSNKFWHWAPRVMSLAFVIFLSLFAFDVFDEYQGLAALPALLMHLLIPLVLLLAVIAAWKRDLIGAIVFLVFALCYVGLAGFNRPWSWYAVISGPAIIVAILFLLSWWKKQKLVAN